MSVMPDTSTETSTLRETLEAIRQDTISALQTRSAASDIDARYLRPFDLVGISTLSSLSVIGPTGTVLAAYVDAGYGIQLAPSTTGTISFTVQQGFAITFVGVLFDGASDLGASGSYSVTIDSVKRQELASRTTSATTNLTVYHQALALNQIATANQGSKVVLTYNNSSAVTVTGCFFPVAFIAASKAQLQMQ